MPKSIAVVGDSHLNENKVSSRLDNCLISVLDKMARLLEKHDYLLILGDFFNRPNMSIESLNYIIQFLGKYRGRIHTILGNHDAYYRTLSLDKTAVGLLNNIGILELHLDTFELAGVSFDVASVVPELKLPEKKSDILLGHFYLDNRLAPKESLTLKELSNYKYVFLGHDHSPYEPIVTSSTTVYRNGSLFRTDAQEYNLTRNSIRYAEIVGDIISLKSLIVNPADEVFLPEVIDKPVVNNKYDLKSLENLIADFKPMNTDFPSTEAVLKEIDTPEPCVEYLRLVHESLGLSF